MQFLSRNARMQAFVMSVVDSMSASTIENARTIYHALCFYMHIYIYIYMAINKLLLPRASDVACLRTRVLYIYATYIHAEHNLPSLI